MSKFFVGQRVRIVGAEAFPEVIGTATVVTQLDVTGISLASGHMTPGMIQVALPPPGYESAKMACHPDWLEPILPEGAAPSEFTFQQLMDELKRIEA